MRRHSGLSLLYPIPFIVEFPNLTVYFVQVAAVGTSSHERQLCTYSGPLSGSSRKATSQKKTATVDISFMFSGRILLIELIV